jgi:hypothetical protein
MFDRTSDLLLSLYRLMTVMTTGKKKREEKSRPGHRISRG